MEGIDNCVTLTPFPELENRKLFRSNFGLRDCDYISKKYGGAEIGNKVKRGFRKIKRKLAR